MQNQPANSPTISIARIHKNARFRLSVFSYSLSVFLILMGFLFHTQVWLITPLLLTSVILFTKTQRVKRQLCEMELNGEELIISGNRSNTVTTIKSVRKIRSTRIGRQKFTTVDFKLDGSDRQVTLLTNSSDSPGRILTELKKKKKADL